jgi:hypothetical protein
MASGWTLADSVIYGLHEAEARFEQWRSGFRMSLLLALWPSLMLLVVLPWWVGAEGTGPVSGFAWGESWARGTLVAVGPETTPGTAPADPSFLPSSTPIRACPCRAAPTAMRRMLDTPGSLLQRGRIDQARQALQSLRGAERVRPAGSWCIAAAAAQRPSCLCAEGLELPAVTAPQLSNYKNTHHASAGELSDIRAEFETMLRIANEGKVRGRSQERRSQTTSRPAPHPPTLTTPQNHP